MCCYDPLTSIYAFGRLYDSGCHVRRVRISGQCLKGPLYDRRSGEYTGLKLMCHKEGRQHCSQRLPSYLSRNRRKDRSICRDLLTRIPQLLLRQLLSQPRAL